MEKALARKMLEHRAAVLQWMKKAVLKNSTNCRRSCIGLVGDRQGLGPVSDLPRQNLVWFLFGLTVYNLFPESDPRLLMLIYAINAYESNCEHLLVFNVYSCRAESLATFLEHFD